MSLAALTFSQEIQKTLVQALATAVSVTVRGGLVADVVASIASVAARGARVPR